MKITPTILQQRISIIVLMIPFVLLAAMWGKEIYTLSELRAGLKKDFSKLNSIEYGLLSADKWSDNIAEIVATQIDEFRLKAGQEKQLQVALDKILNALITQGEEMMDEKQKGFGNKIKKFAFKTFVDTDKIRERVPEFSKTIIKEIKDPANKETLKDIASDKLEQYADQTRDVMVEESEHTNVMIKYHGKTMNEINRMILQQSDIYQERIYNLSFNIIGCMILFLLVWFLIRKNSALYTPMFVLSVALALLVLIVGVLTPMIEIDARIKEINFLVLNKTIQFRDQVIFFQSKSIMDVVNILIKTKKTRFNFCGYFDFDF